MIKFDEPEDLYKKLKTSKPADLKEINSLHFEANASFLQSNTSKPKRKIMVQFSCDVEDKSSSTEK